MKTHNFLLYMVILVAGLSGCRRESIGFRDGTYSGTFTVHYYYPGAWDTTLKGPVVVKFEDGRYECSGGEDYIPAGAIGRFELDADSIHFNNESFFTMDYDGNLHLSGDYEYGLEGKRLTLRYDFAPGWYYLYEIERE